MQSRPMLRACAAGLTILSTWASGACSAGDAGSESVNARLDGIMAIGGGGAGSGDADDASASGSGAAPGVGGGGATPPQPICAAGQECCWPAMAICKKEFDHPAVCRPNCVAGEVNVPMICNWGPGLCGETSCEPQCAATCTYDEDHEPTNKSGYCACRKCHRTQWPVASHEELQDKCFAYCDAQSSHNSKCWPQVEWVSNQTGIGTCECECKSDCSD